VISTIAKLLRLPSIDSVSAARIELLSRHHLLREDDVKEVVVQLRSEYAALRVQHRAELLAFGEKVREACAEMTVVARSECFFMAPEMKRLEARVRAMDVARLLEDGES
jgi:hypothetical protein